MDEKMAQSTEHLLKLLNSADQQDLDILIQYNYGEHQSVSSEELVKTILANGSHDIGRRLWGQADYLEIVRDVADRFGIKWHKSDDEQALENRLLVEIFQQSWQKMPQNDKLAFHEVFGHSEADSERLSRALIDGTFYDFLPATGYLIVWNVTRLVAAAAAREAGIFTAESLLGSFVAELLGPVGIIAGVVILLTSLAGPAYRKTIPTVIQVAYIRQKSQLQARGYISSL
jgi:uncharacterized protein YaaW (UPF0174 family)